MHQQRMQEGLTSAGGKTVGDSTAEMADMTAAENKLAEEAREEVSGTRASHLLELANALVYVYVFIASINCNYLISFTV